eukprot:5443893-Pleurochrysis_carterae.AAC.3
MPHLGAKRTYGRCARDRLHNLSCRVSNIIVSARSEIESARSSVSSRQCPQPPPRRCCFIAAAAALATLGPQPALLRMTSSYRTHHLHNGYQHSQQTCSPQELHTAAQHALTSLDRHTYSLA